MTNVKTMNNHELVEKLKFLVSEELKNISAQIILLKAVVPKSFSAMHNSLFSFVALRIIVIRSNH